MQQAGYILSQVVDAKCAKSADGPWDKDKIYVGLPEEGAVTVYFKGLESGFEAWTITKREWAYRDNPLVWHEVGPDGKGDCAYDSPECCMAIYRVTADPGAEQFTDYCTVWVLEVDLDIAGTTEENEETVGGFVGLNDDDDNGNSTADKDESGTVTGEDDLVSISISYAPDYLDTGQVKLEATGGSSKIKVWENATKGTEVTLPETWDLSEDEPPETLYVEGYQTSSSVRDVTLKLSYIRGDETICDDSVKATVFRVEITGSDKTRFIPLSDDPDLNTITIYYTIKPTSGSFSLTKLRMRVWNRQETLVFSEDYTDAGLLTNGTHEIEYDGIDNQTSDDVLDPNNDPYKLKLTGYYDEERNESNELEIYADPWIVAVYIGARVDNNDPATTNLAPQPYDKAVGLFAIVKALRKTGGGESYHTYYCGYDTEGYNDYPTHATVDSTPVTLYRWQADTRGWSNIEFEWKKIHPTYASYDDEAPDYYDIEFGAKSTSAWKKAVTWSTGSQVNIFRYQVIVRYRWIGGGVSEQAWSTPGKNAVDQNGIQDSVRRVVWLKDWSSPETPNFLKYVGSNGGACCICPTGADVRADNFIGMDCADLPISGWRKLGSGHSYTEAQGLYDRADAGTYTMVTDSVAGNAVPEPEPGDIILINFGGEGNYDHTVIFREGPGGDGDKVDTGDKEFSVHFDGWVDTNYRVAGNAMKSSWIDENDIVSVIRLK